MPAWILPAAIGATAALLIDGWVAKKMASSSAPHRTPLLAPPAAASGGWGAAALGGAGAAMALETWLAGRRYTADRMRRQAPRARRPAMPPMAARTSGSDFRSVGPDGYDWRGDNDSGTRYLEYLGALVSDGDLSGAETDRSIPFHLGGGGLPANEQGLDCSVRLVKDDTRWRAIATCSTSKGPFTLEASCDENQIAQVVGPLLAREAAQDTAKKDVLAKVGSIRCGNRRREEAFLERLERRDATAIRLAHLLKRHAPHDPRARAFWNRVREIYHQRSEGAARDGGWPFPSQMVAGIDLDSQPRPRKSLSQQTLASLQASMRRAAG